MMRRKDRQVTAQEWIDRVVAASRVCRLGLACDNVPYVVPVSFGYDGTAVYFHTAAEGRKLDFISANNLVCFELEGKVELTAEGSDPCDWSFCYQSVIGYGHVHELVDPAEKVAGLRLIAGHYAGGEWEFGPARVAATRVWKITVEQITGKQTPNPEND